MRHSKTRQKLQAGRPVKLAMMGHFVPLFVAQAAQQGYDAIWIDLEHRAMDKRELQALLAFCHLYDIDGLIRPPTREKGELYRYLEDGATGLIMPLIENAEEAREIVNKIKFPPLGDRGLEGKGLDANFGLDTATPEGKDRFVNQANQETVFIPQIESPAALSHAEAIAAVEGVDVIFIGPTDFELRAKGGEVMWEAALAQMATAAKKTGKAWGAMPRNLEHVQNLFGLGAQFIPYGIDSNLLIAGLNKTSQELDALYGH